MKTYHKLRISTLASCLLAIAVGLSSCSIEGDDLSLDALPVPDFEIVNEGDGNTVMLVNRTNVPAIAYWTVPSTEQSFTGDTASVNFTFQGSYTINLLAVSQGGMSSVSKEVQINQNDPTACTPERPMGFLATCTSKTWRLNPAAGAIRVGPGPGDGSWWASGAGDVTARSCDFNDEYTFHFNAEGTFEFDNQGDFYADDYLGNASFGCEPTSNLSAAQQAWGSGTFRYTYLPNAGVNGLGQLRLTGLGAHIGVKKARNGSENTSPASSVTYDILSMQRNVNGEGYDLLDIGVNIGGDGWWSFTLRSY